MAESFPPTGSAPPEQLQELRREMLWLQRRLEQIEQKLSLTAPAPAPIVAPSPPSQANLSPSFPSPPLAPETMKEKQAPPVEPATTSMPATKPSAPTTPSAPAQTIDWEKLFETAPSQVASPQVTLPRAPLPQTPPHASAPKPVAASVSTAQQQAPASSTVSSVMPPPVSPPPPTPPIGPYTAAIPEEGPSIDWENLIGGKWALWVGSFSLFLAAASFLALTWRYFPPPPPWAKVAMGFGGGLALILGGGYWRERRQHWFSEGLSGAGLAICYLSLWAGVQLYHLIPREAAFGTMAALTALGVYLAVRYNALSLILLSTIGGFLTPVLLRTSGDASASLALLLYIAVLDAGILAVALFKRWSVVTWLSFVCTMLLLTGWASDANFEHIRLAAFGFLTLYFLLFAGAACYYSLARQEPTDDQDLSLLFSATAAYALSGHALLSPILGDFHSAFALALSLGFALLATIIRTRAPHNVPLRLSAGGLSLLALTVAVPLQLEQSALAIGWMVQGGCLLMIARRTKSALLQRAGQIVWAMSLFLVFKSLTNDAKPPLFFNERALPLLIGVIVTGIVALDTHFAARRKKEEGEERTEPTWGDELSPLYATFAVAGGGWLLAQEIYTAFKWTHNPNWQTGALFVIAMVWALYALVIYSCGLKWRHAVVRLNALLIASLAGALPLWAGLSHTGAQWTPIWNWRTLSFAVVSLVWLALGRLLKQDAETIEESEAQAFGFWPVLSAVLILCGASLEIYGGFGLHQPVTGDWKGSAWFALVMLWSLAAALLAYLGGIWRLDQLRALAYLLGMGAITALLIDAVTYDPLTAPLFNLRFSAFGCAVIACLFIAAAPRSAEITHEEKQLPGYCMVIAALLALWGATQEIYETCRFAQDAIAQYGRGASSRVTAFFTITVFWSIFAALLASSRAAQQVSLRAVAYGTATSAIGLLLFTTTAFDVAGRPLLNERFIAFALVIAALAMAGRRLRDEALESWETAVPAQLSLAAVLLGLWSATQETYEICRFFQTSLGTHWKNVAWLAIAALWQSCALFLLRSGLSKRQGAWRFTAYFMGTAGAVGLLLDALMTTRLDWTPLLNARSLTFALTVIVWAQAALAMQRQRKALGEGEASLVRPIGLLAVVLLGWALTQETFASCYFFRASLGKHWDLWAQMAISLVWSLYGAMLLIDGIRRNYQPLRLAALCLLSATVVKVFLFDLSFLDGALRILSLGGLGIALIFISWLYSRFGTPRHPRYPSPSVP